ncbi:MAG: N-(5'-phosphoribosyl)anthranilate isomerase [Silicimonas sp.]|nr:N-(5'-phosphoribosyl)anthranilate isomerase [Silicimonas sp.]
MSVLPNTLKPDQWLRHMFSSKAARDGGVIRRQTRDVERIIGMDAFQREIRRRGYRAVINGDQIVVFCNRSTLELIE